MHESVILQDFNIFNHLKILHDAFNDIYNELFYIAHEIIIHCMQFKKLFEISNIKIFI